MRWMILVVWFIVTVFVPTGSGLRISPAAAAPVAQAGRPCQNIQLLIRPQSSQGAAGTITLIYRIHNLSGQACTLYGYPGVQLLDRHFLSLPTAVHRGGGFLGRIPVRLVQLGAYGNAYFTLSYSDVPINNQPCPAAFNLMVFAPNDLLPVVTYVVPRGGSIIACSGNINVSPVTARPRYQ